MLTTSRYIVRDLDGQLLFFGVTAHRGHIAPSGTILIASFMMKAASISFTDQGDGKQRPGDSSLQHIATKRPLE
jgi:hypothetical protein